MSIKTTNNPRGAGRKQKSAEEKRQSIAVRLPPYLIEKLGKSNRGKTIEAALVAYFNNQAS